MKDAKFFMYSMNMLSLVPGPWICGDMDRATATSEPGSTWVRPQLSMKGILGMPTRFYKAGPNHRELYRLWGKPSRFFLQSTDARMEIHYL